MNVSKERAPTIVRLQPADVARWRQELVGVYRQAFRPPPYEKGENVVRQFDSTLKRHTKHDGFRCVAAMTPDGASPVGFGYGYTSQDGQWWHDQVVAQLDPDTVRAWFSDAFEIVELAVRPSMQARGVGRRLHDALLEPAPHRTAVLSTLDADTRGLRLYRKRGWQVIRSDFRFGGVREPYLIMGLRLPLQVTE